MQKTSEQVAADLQAEALYPKMAAQQAAKKATAAGTYPSMEGRADEAASAARLKRWHPDAVAAIVRQGVPYPASPGVKDGKREELAGFLFEGFKEAGMGEAAAKLETELCLRDEVEAVTQTAVIHRRRLRQSLAKELNAPAGGGDDYGGPLTALEGGDLEEAAAWHRANPRESHDRLYGRRR